MSKKVSQAKINKGLELIPDKVIDIMNMFESLKDLSKQLDIKKWLDKDKKELQQEISTKIVKVGKVKASHIIANLEIVRQTILNAFDNFDAMQQVVEKGN